MVERQDRSLIDEPIPWQYLGPSGLNITTRLMGLVLAAIAVQFAIRGVESVLPEPAAVIRAVPRS